MVVTYFFDEFYKHYFNVYIEFQDILCWQANFLDEIYDLVDLEEPNKEYFLNDKGPYPHLEEFKLLLDEKEIHFLIGLNLEIRNNSNLEIDKEEYFNHIYYQGVFKLYMYYIHYLNQFEIAKKALGEKVYNQKFRSIEKLYFTKGVNKLYFMASEIIRVAFHNGVYSLLEPIALSEAIIIEDIDIDDPSYTLFFNINSSKIGLNNLSLLDHLGDKAEILIPYLRQEYGSAKPKIMARLIVALDELKLVVGLFNGKQIHLHQMLCEINPDLKLRGFTKALRYNNPKDPKNSIYITNRAYRKELHQEIRLIKEKILKVMNN
jgi:hypothetical protein